MACTTKDGERLEALINIGAGIADKLRGIGVGDRQSLRDLTAPVAYQALSALEPGRKLPVCYYLYALQGAIEDRDWRTLSKREKSRLCEQAGLCPSKGR